LRPHTVSKVNTKYHFRFVGSAAEKGGGGSDEEVVVKIQKVYIEIHKFYSIAWVIKN
jgi:hypothetical protein